MSGGACPIRRGDGVLVAAQSGQRAVTGKVLIVPAREPPVTRNQNPARGVLARVGDAEVPRAANCG